MSGSKRARLAREAPAFKVVPTSLTGFNRASKIGGAPLSCLTLLHGPSGGGKTVLAAALMGSFQKAGGIVALVDVEQAADTKRWLPALGVDLSRTIYVGRTEETEEAPPFSFEEAADEVDGILDRVTAAKKTGTLSQDAPLLIVIDSISRLVPRNFLKKLEKEGADGLGGALGRAQAQLNKAWLADLGLKIGSRDVLVVAIAHEIENAAATKWVADWKVKGGQGLVYDSMMQVRVWFAGKVADRTKDGDSDRVELVGKKHCLKILKNKHGPPMDEAVFFTATGAGECPMGFDKVREVVTEAIRRGHAQGPKDLTLGSKIVVGDESWTLKNLYTEEGLGWIDKLAKDLDVELFRG